ncbi:MAG: AraC family transcriptional regulator [Lachnospiraceae bacterium]|nr:AraC family transcriptional regulator [Lachnospiraceae bacterium]
MYQNSYLSYQERKHHFPETFPYNIYLCSIPLDFQQVPLHWQDETEFIVIKKGSGIVVVDFVEYRVREGDIVLILPGHMHSISQDGAAKMEYENILFDSRFLMPAGVDVCTKELISHVVTGHLRLPVLFRDEVMGYEEIRRCITDIDTVSASALTGYELAVKGSLYRIFSILYLYPTAQVSSRKEEKLEKLKLILQYIHEHYAQALTLEELAGLAYYSPSHFMRFFKQHMGMSVIAYINNYRMNIAASLLRTGDQKIAEIALHIGFVNLSYFNRLFKETYGMTPRDYRRQNRSTKRAITDQQT